MTNQTPRDARPSSLHRRLTVALANAADRARLADVIATDLGGPVGDGTPLVRSEDLWLAADGFAQVRAGERRELRSRLDAVAARTMHDCDTARHQHEHLLGWRRTLLDGADWASQLDVDLPAHLAAVEAARDFLDERRAEQRAAQQDLERVLEQRSAAAAAIEQADRELADLSGTGMDESGLRRELEAAGQAVQDAQSDHDVALARLEELQIEATGLQVRREEAVPPPPAPGAPAPVDLAGAIRVRDALADLQSVSIIGEADSQARALAEAWTDLSADLASVGGEAEGPSDEALDAARQRVQLAAARLAELDEAAASGALTPAQRAAIDAAHAAVLEAEEQTGRRRGAGAARKQLEQAQAAERALLDQHGFGGYLDVVLTGGRAAADPSRPVAEREHFEALHELEALERTASASPQLTHLRSERARLLEFVRTLLGVDPGDQVLPLLRAHRPTSLALQRPLVEALAAVGVRPVGISLPDAAMAFLEAHPIPELDEAEPTRQAPVGVDPHAVERAAIDARAAANDVEVEQAQADVERTEEALHMARRTVEAFEGELSVRAGEDLARIKRLHAAEQLRTQIDAVASTLRRAEDDARKAIEVVDHAVAAAEATYDQATAEVSDLARRTRRLAEELPIDQRPDGDPLRTLPTLAARLVAHSTVLQPEIDQAEAAVASAAAQLEDALTACQLAGTGDDGPQPDDFCEGLEQLLAPGLDGVLLLLDEPFVGIDQTTRHRLLEVVRQSSTSRQLVLLTEDAEVLGWAIELPIEEATAVPADALLARIRRSNQDLVPAASTPHAVDITTSAPPVPTTHPEPAPAPTARRWAGQR